MLLFPLKFIIFIIPLYLIRFSVLGIPTTVLEVFIYLLFAFWLLMKIRNRDWNLKIFSNKIFIPIAFIFFGVIISTIFSDDFILSAGIWKGYFLDPLLFFIVFMDFLSGNKNYKAVIESLLKWFLFSGFIVSVISLIYLFNGNLTYDGRLSAFYLSPNHLAMFLAPVLLINTYFIIKGEKNNRGIFYFSWLVLCAVIYFTRSFGAWMGLTAAILILFLIKSGLFRNKKTFNMKLLYCCLVAFFIITAVLAYYSPVIADYFDPTGRSSFHSRIMIWQSSLKIIKDNFILGIGPGMFQDYYLDYQKHFPPYLEWAIPQPHNIFFAFWLQAGIIGFIGFVLLLWRVFKIAIMEFKVDEEMEESENNKIIYLILSFFIYFFIHGLVDTLYWKNDLALIFWFFVGIIAIFIHQKQKMIN